MSREIFQSTRTGLAASLLELREDGDSRQEGSGCNAGCTRSDLEAHAVELPAPGQGTPQLDPGASPRSARATRGVPGSVQDPPAQKLDLLGVEVGRSSRRFRG